MVTGVRVCCISAIQPPEKVCISQSPGSSVQALMHLRMCTAELPQFSRIARRVKTVGRTP